MLEYLRAELASARERRAAVKARAEKTVADARAAGHAYTDAERTSVEADIAEIRKLDEDIRLGEESIAAEEAKVARAGLVDAERARVGGSGAAGTSVDVPGAWVRTDTASRRSAAVARGQAFGDHALVREASGLYAARDAAVMAQHGDLGQLVRSMSTTSGSAIVPTMWANQIIDRARNFAAVLKAGATVVPMDTKVVQIGRLTADPTAAFRTEGSTITASDPTFDNVTLTANTMSCLVVGSLEWFMDSINADQIVTEAIAKAVALQLDLTALFGGITTGNEGFNLATPPNPRGVLATLAASAPGNILGAQTNGTTQTALTYWNEVLDTIYTPRDNNESPNAMIWNSKLARQYAKAYDSQGRILTPPPDVDGLEKYISNQIPSFTAGTMTSRATDLFVGDWSQCLIGQRMDFSIQTLTERYAELGQVGIVATWRGDVQLARPKAFACYRYLQGA